MPTFPRDAAFRLLGPRLIHPDGLPLPQRHWAMVATMVGTTLAVLDGTIANVAPPTIAGRLQVSAADSIWVVNAYQLAIVTCLPPLSFLGEGVGYRKVYLGGMLLFTVASLGCALSHTLLQLTLARVAQGWAPPAS